MMIDALFVEPYKSLGWWVYRYSHYISNKGVYVMDTGFGPSCLACSHPAAELLQGKPVVGVARNGALELACPHERAVQKFLRLGDRYDPKLGVPVEVADQGWKKVN